jgi:hypothetical protein
MSDPCQKLRCALIRKRAERLFDVTIQGGHCQKKP